MEHDDQNKPVECPTKCEEASVKLPVSQVEKLRTLIALFNNYLMTQSVTGDDILTAADLMKQAIKTCRELDDKINS